MRAEDVTVQALMKEVSELKINLKELGEENRDLREICNANDVLYEERLATRRHQRYFANLCDKYPIGDMARPSDVLGAAPIVRGISACAGSVFRTGLIARCFFETFTELTAQLPWEFGSRISATFEGHGSVVCLLSRSWR